MLQGKAFHFFPSWFILTGLPDLWPSKLYQYLIFALNIENLSINSLHYGERLDCFSSNNLIDLLAKHVLNECWIFFTMDNNSQFILECKSKPFFVHTRPLCTVLSPRRSVDEILHKKCWKENICWHLQWLIAVRALL